MSKGRSLFVCVLLVSSAVVVAFEAIAADDHDIVIYGSTPAAISAAVQAKRSGKSVVVVSPETRIGGMTTGGLGQSDGARLSCYGGIAKEFYRAVKRHYDDPAVWTRQKKESFAGRAWAGGDGDYSDTMWTFEPSAALAILEGWEKRDGLEIHRGKRLDRSAGKVKVEGEGERRRIVSFFTEDGTEYRGKVFVDATYEGDLMAAAGVSYTVGREGNEVYGETVNGIQRTLCGKGHRFVGKVDPYVEKGNPSSGLLKCVERDCEAPDGTGDRHVQAYCFRLCLTTDPENRVPFEKPEGYDERDYELAFRDFEGRETGMVWLNPPMPNLKSDCNTAGAVSLDFIGGSDRWPEASYAEREQIFAAHVKWQKGVLWTYANHPRIPEKIRREVSRWGLAKDEFVESGNWPTQLYVREGRRMVGKYVITENDCRRKRRTPKPVLQASFNMDVHNVRRVIGKDGFVFNEGDVQAPPLPPFHFVSYDALVPKDGECANLIVPVCLSASHIAYGSIRMEPMFFGLGQVAALGAVRAIEDGVAVQSVDYAKLRGDIDRAGIPAGEIVLANRFDGKTATILLPEGPTPDEKRAAAELADGLEKLTGAKSPGGEARIRLERTDAYGEEGFRLHAENGDLVISGGTRGVLYGVRELLETYGGVSGLKSDRPAVPNRDAFSVPDNIDVVRKPTFSVREAMSDSLQFTCHDDQVYLTHPKLRETIRFAAVADSHFAMLDGRDEQYRQFAVRMMQWPGKESELDQVFAAARKHKAEFVAMIGDMLSFPSLANIEFLKQKIAMSGLDCWYIAGNHDWCFEGYGRPDGDLRGKWFGERMRDLYRGKDPMGYSFVKKGVRFVFVDNSPCRITDEQLAFVRGELDCGDPVVLFVHVPFYMNVTSCDDTMANPHFDKEDRSKVFRELVFSSRNVLAVFAGHDHVLEVGSYKGVPQFILPECYTTGRSLNVVLSPACER